MLYVTTGRAGTILEVDLASGTVTNTVQVGQRPWGVDISPDGRFLYTANGPSDDISVVDRESFEQVATIPVGETPWGVEVAPVPTP
jgi:YVTN family beta-propeller protein